MLQGDYGQRKQIQRPQKTEENVREILKQRVETDNIESFMLKLEFPTESVWDLSVPHE